MGKSWRDRVNNLSPTVSPALKILGVTAALITTGTALGEWTGVGSILSKSVRDDLSDFFTADVVVWQLLLTVGAALIVALAVWWFARWQLGNSEGSMTDTRPTEVGQFGVLWPIFRPRGGGLRVGKPMCRKDKSTLARFVENKLVSLLNDWEDSITAR